MGCGNVGDFVPADEPGRCTFRVFWEEIIYVFNMLGKQMDSPAVLRRQPFDLFDDAKLSTMHTIQKWRHDNNLQAGPPFCSSVSNRRLRDLKISWKLRNPEQNAKHQPKIGVHDEVLVGHVTVEAHWE